MDAVEVQPDQASFQRVALALDGESNGVEWRGDMSAAMGEALRPGVSAVRSAIMSRGGGSHEGAPLRAAIAAHVHVVPLRSGATIVADKAGMPRNFANAPKRFNERGGFRRRVYGTNTWVVQVGAPGWFDDTLDRLHPRLRAAALAALEGRARRISRKA